MGFADGTVCGFCCLMLSKKEEELVAKAQEEFKRRLGDLGRGAVYSFHLAPWVLLFIPGDTSFQDLKVEGLT